MAPGNPVAMDLTATSCRNVTRAYNETPDVGVDSPVLYRTVMLWFPALNMRCRVVRRRAATG